MKLTSKSKSNSDRATDSAAADSASFSSTAQNAATGAFIGSEPPDAEIVVAVFRTVVLVAALFVPRLLNGLAPVASSLVWLAAIAGAYNLLVVGAYFWRGRLSLRRPFIIAMDLVLITLWIRLTSGWSLFPLYYVVVVVAAMWYRIWGAVLTAFCCNALYLLMLIRGLAASANAAPPTIGETLRLILQLPFLGTSLALNVALLFLVGSLVGSLALAQERERTRRLEEQLLLANYQREIDLSTQLQPLLVSPEWFAQNEELRGEISYSENATEIISEAARGLTNAHSSTRFGIQNPLSSNNLPSAIPTNTGLTNTGLQNVNLPNANLQNAGLSSRLPALMPQTRASLADRALVKLGATMQTAREFGGGDYFDFIPLENGRSALCIADVSGKSVRAQARLPLLKYALRALAPLYSEPDALVARLNKTLAPDLQNDLFIGLCYIVLDPRANKLHWCNAGHIAPLLLASRAVDEKNRAIPELIALETLGPALGLFSDAQYEAKSALWRPGDRILLFTDGLSDALSYRGREDGEEQVRHIALETEASAWLAPQNVAQHFLELAQDALDDRDSLFTRLSPLRRHEPLHGHNARRDDITVVVARRTLPDEK